VAKRPKNEKGIRKGDTTKNAEKKRSAPLKKGATSFLKNEGLRKKKIREQEGVRGIAEPRKKHLL